MLIFTKGEDL